MLFLGPVARDSIVEKTKAKFQKYIFVCENKREDGRVCCMPQGEKIREALKKLVKEQGLSDKIRVSRAGCLDVCEEGPNVLVMPDNIWYRKVDVKDAAKIIANL